MLAVTLLNHFVEEKEYNMVIHYFLQQTFKIHLKSFIVSALGRWITYNEDSLTESGNQHVLCQADEETNMQQRHRVKLRCLYRTRS